MNKIEAETLSSEERAVEAEAEQIPKYGELMRALLYSLGVSLAAGALDFALFYALFEKAGFYFLGSVILGKLIGIAIKYGFFAKTNLIINSVMYRKSLLRFLIISLLSMLFAVTLIDVSVLFLGLLPLPAWLVMSGFAWAVANLLVVFFGKILLIVGKSSVSSFTATTVDFMIYNLMLALIGDDKFYYANAVSKFCGATTNFTIHKYWAFNVREGSYSLQYLRYLAISSVSYFLNTGIIYALKTKLELDPRLGQIIAGFLVWLCWNFVMTRLFVFKLPVFHDDRKK